jgi:2-amino-4-hydroxy-6-hydroxymethyldihydropteridine diphosphokinase
MNEALIGLGSNLGDRPAHLRAGCLQMLQNGITILSVSSLYESNPVGYTSPNAFLNAVVKVRTGLNAAVLMAVLQTIERDAGRQKTDSYTDRPIDLDILFFGNSSINVDALVVPHPRAHQRGFVLVPAVEIAPDWKHPLLEKTLTELLKGLNTDSEGIRIFSSSNWLNNV